VFLDLSFMPQLSVSFSACHIIFPSKKKKKNLKKKKFNIIKLVKKKKMEFLEGQRPKMKKK
jgi:hypothetical protein